MTETPYIEEDQGSSRCSESDGLPHIDPVIMHWDTLVITTVGVLVGIGSIAFALGAPVVGGLLLVAAGLHLGLLSDEGPIVTE